MEEEHFMNPNSPKPRKPIRIVYPIAVNKKDSAGGHVVDKKIKRVLAPYVKIIHRGQKNRKEKLPRQSDRFKQYAEEKPTLLKNDFNEMLSNSIDLLPLINQTADVLKDVTNANGVTVYIVEKDKGEIYISPRNVANSRYKVNWKIEPERSLASFVAYSMEHVIVDDVLKDPRFPDGIPYVETAKAVLAAPILTEQNSCYAVIELYRTATEDSFDENDSKIVIVVAGWLGAAVDQNHKRLSLEKQKELNNYLLNLTNCFFTDNVHQESMITQVVSFAKDTVGAERGSFFIIDSNGEDLKATMYDEGISAQEDGSLYKRTEMVHLNEQKGIACFVAQNGISLNIADAYNDRRFQKEVDKLTGCITRSVLCVPIKAVDEVVGVLQVINKKSSTCFTKDDEGLLTIFGSYCALAIQYIRLQNKMVQTSKLNQSYSNLLKYHMQPCVHSLEQYEYLTDLTRAELPEGFYKFSWYIEPEQNHLRPLLIKYMFGEIFGEETVPSNILLQFILSVELGYRDNPYHNFEHAFNVCHCMYLMLVKNKIHFSPLELTALIVSAYGHDLHHKGYTNNFLNVTNDILSQLYEDSPLENYHYIVTMKIVKDTNLLQFMSETMVKKFDREVKHAILATDLGNHFKCRTRLIQIMHDDLFEWTNDVHRQLIKDIMIVTCDLSGQCKPQDIARKITEQLCKEFYNQGDKEKEMGLCPLSMMDRDKQNLLPEGQLQFLSVVVKPCTELLSYFFPNTEELLAGVEKLCETWEQIIRLRGIDNWCQEDSLAIDT